MSEHGPRAGRILVIEPSPTQAMILGGLLRRQGFDVVQASAGAPRPAVDPVVADAALDLVVADAALHDPALQALLHAVCARGVPWLALMPDGAAGLAADAAAWVTKPVTLQDLQDAIGLCLARPQARRWDGGMDLDAIDALWGSADNATFRQVVKVFLGEMEQRLTAIAKALDAHDWERIVIEAHSFGSAAAAVGCTPLSQAAQALEAAAALAPAPGLPQIVSSLRDRAELDRPVLARLVTASGPDA